MTLASPRRGTSLRLKLAIGGALYAIALSLTPHEMEAAKLQQRLDARTAATLACYLAAAILILGNAPAPKGRTAPKA